MRKRYVFWRSSTGKPYRGTDDKEALASVLAEIGKMAEVADGRVSWNDAFSFFRCETALRSSLVVLGPDGDELNGTDGWSFIQDAATDVLKAKGGKRPISPAELLSEADERAAAFFRRDPIEYVVVSSLSVKTLPAKKITLTNSTVHDLRNRSKRFPLPPAVEHESRYSELGDHIKKNRNKHVAIKTSGRSIHDAMSRALTDLTLLRGLWTFFATYGSWSISSNNTKQKPLGVIHAGPIHTLHHPDGRSVEDAFWREREFIEIDGLFSPNKGWDRIEKDRRWAQHRLKSLPHRSDVEDLISRYVVALDQANLDVAFLHLWSVLEKVTDTVGANYDETIRRAVWVFGERQLQAEILRAVRLRRNRLVHAAISGEDRDQIVYMIKGCVEPHLLRLIRNDFGVDSLEEYGKYLALPTDVGTVERQHRRSGRALRLLRKWSQAQLGGG